MRRDLPELGVIRGPHDRCHEIRRDPIRGAMDPRDDGGLAQRDLEIEVRGERLTPAIDGE